MKTVSKHTAPKVSVIIPCYNAELYLRECMDSVLSQTLAEIEVICVDDGSTDGTLEILREYEAGDSRVKVLLQRNMGAGAARNVGLEKAHGKYLWFLDSDDFAESTMLEKSVQRLEQTGSDMLVVHHDAVSAQSGEVREGWGIKDEWLCAVQPVNHTQFKGNVFLTFVGWPWDKVFLASFVKKYNLTFQEQRTSNDLKFVFSAIVLSSSIDVLPDVLVHHRIENERSLENTRAQSWWCFYDALLSLRRKLRGHCAFSDVEDDFVRYALNFSLWHLDTLSGEAKENVRAALKNGWLKKLGCTTKAKDFFENKNDYTRMEFLCKM